MFHIGYFKHTLQVLQCICKTCSRILLDEASYGKYQKVFRGKLVGSAYVQTADVLGKQSALKRVVDLCKKVSTCRHCGAHNGVVKKVTGLSTLKIIHDPFGSKNEGGAEEMREQLETATDVNQTGGSKDLSDVVNTSAKFNALVNIDLLPTVVLDLFKRIPDADAELLWLDPSVGRPENLLLVNLLVPPVPIRPSVAMDVGGGSNEDDLTVKLQEIIDVNIALKLALEKGAPHKTILEEWDFLQLQIAQYINGEMPGLQRPIGQSKQVSEEPEWWRGERTTTTNETTFGRVEPFTAPFAPSAPCSRAPPLQYFGASSRFAPCLTLLLPLCSPVHPSQIRGLCQRLKGKSGRFRGNLSGKRVDFSARTVISPDPNLKVSQVGVPVQVAMTMTFPEKVTRYNISKLRKCIRNGPSTHPGANHVRNRAKNGKEQKRSLQYGNRDRTAEELREGDVVDRHMEDGDIVLFNRQPR